MHLIIRNIWNALVCKICGLIENRIDIPDEIPPIFDKMCERVLKDNKLKIVKVKNRLQLRKYIKYILML